MWSREDIVWFAGYFEGEGCIRFVGSNRWVMTISSTDFDVLEKARRIAGMGHMYGPYSRPGKPHHKPIWQWRLVGAKKVYALAAAIFPFMGERRGAKIKEFVEKFKSLKPNIRRRDGVGKFVKEGSIHVA